MKEVKAIHDKCVEVEKKLSALGYITPECAAYIHWLNEGCSFRISYKSSPDALQVSKFFQCGSDEDFSAAVEAMDSFIANDLPSIEEQRMKEFIRKLSSVIEEGKNIGIDVDFINPLTSLMKQLSSNIIEDKSKQNFSS